MDLFSAILLGLVQGVTEWVPISSKTQDTFVYLKLLGGSPELVIPVLLYLHLGTLFAAVLYFRRQLRELWVGILAAPLEPKTYVEGPIGFLLAALLCTGIVGFPILLLEKEVLPALDGTGLYLLMGAGLIVTGLLLLSQKNYPARKSGDVGFKDGILTGLLQGLSTIPGISRSGTTSTALIWRRFDPEAAFNLSFLLSIPSVACTEVVFYLASASGGLPLAEGLALAVSSFVFGYLTLDIILRLVKRVNLAYLSFALGLLIMASAALQAG